MLSSPYRFAVLRPRKLRLSERFPRYTCRLAERRFR
jgi:hypothetical protein